MLITFNFQWNAHQSNGFNITFNVFRISVRLSRPRNQTTAIYKQSGISKMFILLSWRCSALSTVAAERHLTNNSVLVKPTNRSSDAGFLRVSQELPRQRLVRRGRVGGRQQLLETACQQFDEPRRVAAYGANAISYRSRGEQRRFGFRWNN